jgi:nucleotide-binding universal stress UspA family protein
VLVATDFGSSSLRAVRFAAELAAQLSARLTVLHVIHDVPPMYPVESPPPLPLPAPDERERGTKRELDQFLETLENGARPCEGVVRFGEPSHEIVAYAAESACDLVVVGTHGRGALSRLLLGSVASRVLRASAVPVLIVPSGP